MNHYAAPGAPLAAAKHAPGQGHVSANAAALALFVLFLSGLPLFIGVACAAMPSFRQIFAPMVAILLVMGMLGIWPLATMIGLLRRRRWALTSARIFWVFTALGLWPIPLAAYGFMSLGLPQVRRLFGVDVVGV